MLNTKVVNMECKFSSVSSDDIFTSKNDGVVLFTYEEGSDAEARFEVKFGMSVRLARQNKEFEGKAKQTFLDRALGTPRFHLLVGLGKKESADADALRSGASAAAVALRGLGAKRIAIELPQGLDARIAGQAAAEGALLSAYQFLSYRTQKLDEVNELQSVTVFGADAAKEGVDAGRVIAESCNMARDLQNTPSSDLTPEIFAQQAMRLAKDEGVRCAVMDAKTLAKQGFGGIASVGRGSLSPPCMVTLEYAPKGAKRTVAVVGKGLTFDSGGISLKPGKGMAEMKFDMSGAAAVLGIIRAASRLKLPVRVIGVMGLAENMPDGGSYKPGDVVRTKLGKTIEIDNTDAEGRVVLADALYLATTFKPDMLIDLATLTGAAVVCLGDVAAPVLGNDQGAIDKVVAASKACGEKVWQLPLWDDYAEDIKSSIADMRNVGDSGKAGTIAGAMLLKEFVGSTPWAHIDIAGVAWAQGRERYFTPVGGTGFGVRLVTRLLQSESE